MGDWQADVFVEMKSLHFGPVDARRPGQSIQKFKLRGRRRRNDPRMATLGYGTLRGRRLPERYPTVEYFEQHKECTGCTEQDCASQVAKLYKRVLPSRLRPEH